MSRLTMTKVIAGLAAVLLYVGWSSYRIHQLSGDLEKEKTRFYKLADGFELLQSVSKNDCSFDVSALPKSRLLYVEEVKEPESLSALPRGARLFLYSLTLDDKKKEEFDKKYRGEGLLRYEPSILVDKQGRVLSLEWSKP
ncbi:hypothetical protein [Archangium lipolyticum]|uniref:hypothetical protein n=1 Tax=Archangium lipolyticum TaxID=2970465 RepID=UPI002149E863|nr:hypothetical protein [Archangium lipolyticum]